MIWKFLKGHLLLLVILYPLTGLRCQNSAYDEQVRKYVENFKDIAVKEMMLYRIPASITLAQGIFESNAGSSRLAMEANNHFGIKCHKEWNGPTFTQDDETRNECFRKYDDPEESFRDHSCFLAQRDRYKELFQLDITDYKGWAKGLKESGYATNPQYPEKLIKAIETYGLDKFDVSDFSQYFTDSVKYVADTAKKPVHPVSKYEMFAEGPGGRPVYINNGLQFIIFKKGDNIHKIAMAFKVTERRIYRWNDLRQGSRLVPGQLVYLESKKQKGAATFHIVKAGETFYTISQQYGIQLKYLYKRNSRKPGQSAKTGERILLR